MITGRDSLISEPLWRSKQSWTVLRTSPPAHFENQFRRNENKFRQWLFNYRL